MIVLVKEKDNENTSVLLDVATILFGKTTITLKFLDGSYKDFDISEIYGVLRK